MRPQLRDTASGTGDWLFEQPPGLRTLGRPWSLLQEHAPSPPPRHLVLRTHGQSSRSRAHRDSARLSSTQVLRCRRAPQGHGCCPSQPPARPPWCSVRKPRSAIRRQEFVGTGDRPRGPLRAGTFQTGAPGGNKNDPLCQREVAKKSACFVPEAGRNTQDPLPQRVLGRSVPVHANAMFCHPPRGFGARGSYRKVFPL